MSVPNLRERLRKLREEISVSIPHKFGLWVDSEFVCDYPSWDECEKAAYGASWMHMGKRCTCMEYTPFRGARLPEHHKDFLVEDVS